MRERLHPGGIIEGYVLGERIHEGGTGAIFHATAPAGRDPGFPIVLKAPFFGYGESSLGIIGLEMEQMILARLTGPHVPRFVGAGDVRAAPYIVMEWIDGQRLAEIIARAPLAPEEVARVGAALADAVHSVHLQEVVHLDLKPENFLLRPSGEAVLLDFGFARHARYPDLLAEEKHFAAGSSAYVSPEQLQGDRSDKRSDLFALGVLLYELATGRQPFGEPQTYAGMRDRLWRAPAPPRAVNADVPPWLQEVILRCLEPAAGARYQSAAHVAFDLRHPEQVAPSERGTRTSGLGFAAQAGRWWHARRQSSMLRPPRSSVARRVPVVMVAVDTEHPDDERHPALQWTTRQLISLHPELRLMCISVITAAPVSEGRNEVDTRTGRHLEHKTRLRHWIEPLGFPKAQISLHVVEGANAGSTLLDLARANHVDLIVLGAPAASQRALAWWRSVASSVTANAHCSVHVVRVPERREEAQTNQG
ncbi:MAG TPA: bifunctional serine/threonine-protein kinase/universal stress protein [Casimicrobiaceae bacterium]|nr:bifunctional serine/threonine-protein kinase/universal stress protein [Casimicrobiaceae bacterium]